MKPILATNLMETQREGRGENDGWKERDREKEKGEWKQ